MYTKHAEKRAKQRSISPEVVNILLDFGECSRHKGAQIYFMTNATRREAKQYLGASKYKKVEPKLDTYAVMSDSGSLITLCHRKTRLKF